MPRAAAWKKRQKTGLRNAKKAPKRSLKNQTENGCRCPRDVPGRDFKREPLDFIKKKWPPRQESNLYLALRRHSFYPLNYGEGQRPIVEDLPSLAANLAGDCIRCVDPHAARPSAQLAAWAVKSHDSRQTPAEAQNFTACFLFLPPHSPHWRRSMTAGNPSVPCKRCTSEPARRLSRDRWRRPRPSAAMAWQRIAMRPFCLPGNC